MEAPAAPDAATAQPEGTASARSSAAGPQGSSVDGHASAERHPPDMGSSDPSAGTPQTSARGVLPAQPAASAAHEKASEEMANPSEEGHAAVDDRPESHAIAVDMNDSSPTAGGTAVATSSEPEPHNAPAPAPGGTKAVTTDALASQNGNEAAVEEGAVGGKTQPAGAAEGKLADAQTNGSKDAMPSSADDATGQGSPRVTPDAARDASEPAVTAANNGLPKQADGGQHAASESRIHSDAEAATTGTAVDGASHPASAIVTPADDVVTAPGSPKPSGNGLNAAQEGAGGAHVLVRKQLVAKEEPSGAAAANHGRADDSNSGMLDSSSPMDVDVKEPPAGLPERSAHQGGEGELQAGMQTAGGKSAAKAPASALAPFGSVIDIGDSMEMDSPKPAAQGQPSQERTQPAVDTRGGAAKEGADSVSVGGKRLASQAGAVKGKSKRRRAEVYTPPVTLLQEVREAAYDACPYPVERRKEEKTEYLLVPAFVDTDVTDVSRGVHEQLLWRWGEPESSFRSGAMKLCHDLVMKSEMDIVVERQLAFSLQRMTDAASAPAGVLKHEVLVQLEVAARHGDELLRDSVQWDVAQPYSTPEQYASVICQDLGLRFDWYEAIVEHVRQLLFDIREEIAYEGEAAIKKLLPLKSAYRKQFDQQPAPQFTGPKIVPYSEDLDPMIAWEQRLSVLRKKWRIRDAEEEKIRAAENAKRAAEEAKRKAEEEAQRKKEEAENAKRAEEARKRAEAEAEQRRKEDEERRAREAAEAKAREEARLKAEAEARRVQDEQRRWKEEQDLKRRHEEYAKHLQEQARLKADADASVERQRQLHLQMQAAAQGNDPANAALHAARANAALATSATQHSVPTAMAAHQASPYAQATHTPPAGSLASTPHAAYQAGAHPRPMTSHAGYSPADIARFGNLFQQRTQGQGHLAARPQFPTSAPYGQPNTDPAAVGGAQHAAHLQQQHAAHHQYAAQPGQATTPLTSPQQPGAQHAAAAQLASQHAVQQQHTAAAPRPHPSPGVSATPASFPAMSPAAHAARVAAMQQTAPGAAASTAAAAHSANLIRFMQQMQAAGHSNLSQQQLVAMFNAWQQQNAVAAAAQGGGAEAGAAAGQAAGAAAALRPAQPQLQHQLGLHAQGAGAQLLAQVQQETQAAQQAARQQAAQQAQAAQQYAGGAADRAAQ